jgi:hypothetical protein
MLSDRVIFNRGILPSFETTLYPQLIHLDEVSPSSVLSDVLSPYDILHALYTLSGVRYDDVRNDIVQGLLELLQEEGGTGGEVGFATAAGREGEGSSGGWTAILNLLRCIPASMAVNPGGGKLSPFPFFLSPKN